MEKKLSTREKILLTATRLFYLKGYHAIGLNQIIKESGTPKGSLYHHFPNGKEQLAIEAIQASSKHVGEAINRFMSESDSPLEGIQAHIRMIASVFENEESFNSETFSVVPFGLLATESALENENMRKACEEAFLYWESIYMRKLMSSGYEQEQAERIATAVNAMIEGGVTLALTQKSSEPLLRVGAMIPLLLQR